MNASLSAATAAPATQAVNASRIAKAFELCVGKSRANIKRLADAPKSAPWAQDGNYFAHQESFYDIGNWTSSFHTGMALLAWRQTRDDYFLQQVMRLAPHYHEKVFTRHLDTHHDLGFLYTLYSVALSKLTLAPEQRRMGLRAAEVLAQRFNKKGHFIRAWGYLNTDEQANMAIIDCMMNLPLLYWAARESGNQRFYDIALDHANTCLKHFVRPDASVCHAFRFDLQTGAPLGPDNYCGFSKDSYWARGASWAIYGFALSYAYTAKAEFLQTALRLANKLISQLDGEIVPVWDFRLPSNSSPLRDASAAAILVCGFQQLETIQAADDSLLGAKRTLLNRICSDDYLDWRDSCPGVQKNGQIGTAQNAYTSWGDYFLMEALDRELHHTESFW